MAYQVDDFMNKNTETMETQTRQLLQADGLAFLRPVLEQQRILGAFAPADTANMGALAAGGTGLAGAVHAATGGSVGRVATSTGKRFLRDMSRLMSQLQASR